MERSDQEEAEWTGYRNDHRQHAGADYRGEGEAQRLAYMNYVFFTWARDAPQWGSTMASSAAALLHCSGEQPSEVVGLPPHAIRVLDDLFHARGSRGVVAIVAGML